MISYKEIFTPLFAIFALSILIGGLFVLRMIDGIFIGTPFLTAIRMFGITIILNVIILVFIIMSFARIKFERGPRGPKGNKGSRGYTGSEGKLQSCHSVYDTVQDKKAREMEMKYFDDRNPYIVFDEEQLI